jgi:hypothetical protein
VGLLKGLALLPLAPVQGVAWLADRLATEAERQLDDEAAIRAHLADLAAANDRGEISDEDYDVIEEQLLRQLVMKTRRVDGEGWR